ncbi:protein SENSITIVITY TO RED LIGHT REDUCED 1-like [Cannabis sativa]|uniref:protein SENSITIVITY TO RED LIGHT REDUCED 1-like n=1 Tax=Cannabis sativa TaxID=3483 RepID=UPI0029CA0E8E|nr:protein SENSITIVITY TO RED LIGHT REDUCED 1-like [Cannabis sativa]
MAIVGSRRRSGTTQQNANLPVVSANYKWKKWSYLVPLVVALAVMSDMAFVDRLHFFSGPPPINQEQEPTIQELVQLSKNELETMPFFDNFWDQIQNNENISLRLENLVSSCNDSKIDMVIYCIGSIKHRESSRLQLSLALLLKEKVNWISDTIQIFDPNLTYVENQALRDMGFQVLENNEEGGRKVNKPTLFYMPHCLVDLYVNLLKENQEEGTLMRNVVILGNSFNHYNTIIPSDDVNLLAQKFAHEFQIVRNVVDI